MLLSLCICAATQTLQADEPRTSLNSLEALVSQWSQLRLTAAQEERAFVEQEDQWRTEIALLQQEMAALQAELDRAHGETNGAAVEVLARIQERDRLQQFHEALPDAVAQAEAGLLQWEPLLPEVHREALQSLFTRLPSDDAGRKARATTDRLQTVITLYSEIEKIQSNWFVGKESLSLTDDTQREMDVCYIGLCTAYAVSSDNQHAAVGTPTPTGWIWQPRNDIATSIRTAISIHQRQTPAEMIRLPLSITEAAQ